MNKTVELLSNAGQIKGIHDHAFPEGVEQMTTILSDINRINNEQTIQSNAFSPVQETTLFTRALDWTTKKIATSIENTLNRFQENGSNH